jgi:chromosomal replication initiation ATPase DnaA
MTQEVLNFKKNTHLDWGNFIDSEENLDAMRMLLQWPRWPTNGLVIFGEAGVGKTHLANLWAQSANAVCVLTDSMKHDPRNLFATESNFLLDNFDAFLEAKAHDWIFHFFNISNEKKKFYLLISRKHPATWHIELTDLRSRLFTIPAINIRNPEDQLLLKIAKKIATDLGITVGDEALCYMLNLIDRSVSSIANTLKNLDRLALQEHKPITIPFIRNYLRLAGREL